MNEWVDLTQPITEQTPARPLHVRPTFEDHLTHEADGTASTLVSIETHVGTHMDAPAHFYAGEGHRTIDQVSPAEMVAEGVVCDFSHKAPNSTISGEELRERAERHDLSAGEYVLLDTGAEVADTDAYLLEYVSLDASAAEYLRDVGITCLATDALNVDQSGLAIAEHVVHHTLLSADVLIVEGLTGVDRVSPGRVDVVCTPLPYVGRDGSQVRFLARPQG
jgi:arylformamidase